MSRSSKPDFVLRAPRRPAWLNFAALVCCVVWAIGGLGVLPAIVAFLGSFDSTHEVLVVGTRAGTEVVFHHQTKESEAPGNHSVLMQILATVAATSGESNDHVLDFANAGDCRAGAVRLSAELSAPLCAESLLEFRIGLPAKRAVFTTNCIGFGRLTLGHSATIRSTLLRI